MRDGLDEVIDGGSLKDGVRGGEEGNAVAVATCLGGWDVYAVVAIVVWSWVDIPAMLAVV